MVRQFSNPIDFVKLQQVEMRMYDREVNRCDAARLALRPCRRILLTASEKYIYVCHVWHNLALKDRVKKPVKLKYTRIRIGYPFEFGKNVQVDNTLYMYTCPPIFGNANFFSYTVESRRDGSHS